MRTRALVLINWIVIWMNLMNAGCADPTGSPNTEPSPEASGRVTSSHEIQAPDDATLETATFAGGCFWCMEGPFDQLPGVVSTTSGYTGGEEANPSYEQVASGSTGHAEAVQIRYDPDQVTYERLLEVFWRNIDPTMANGQFADIGPQYRTAIYYHSSRQKQLAEDSKALLEASGKYDRPIVTEITPASVFFPAEEYHQDFYRKNPGRYKSYRIGSGREGYLKKTWSQDPGHNRTD